MAPEDAASGVPPPRSGGAARSSSESFDRLADLAARLLEAPAAFLAVVEGGRVVIRARAGTASSARAAAVRCRAVVAAGRLRAGRGRPARAGAWAGAPVVCDGSVVGAVCVAGPGPREWTDGELALLEDVAALAAVRLQAVEGRSGGWRSPLENAADAVLLLNAGGAIRDASPPVEAVLGHAPAELAGRSAFDFLHPDHAHRLMELLTGGRPGPAAGAPVALRLRHREGGWREVEGVVAGLPGGGLLLSVRDVTEQLRAREAQRRLTAVLEATPDLVATADGRGRILYLNGAGRRMLGIAENEDALHLHIPDLYPRRSAEVVLEQGLPRAAEDGVWTGETALLRRDGVEVPVSQVIVAHRAEDGRLDFFSTIARDITERKAAEEALRRSEEYFRTLTENALDLIVILDGGGTVVYTTPAVRRVLGYAPAEVQGRPAIDFVHPADRPAVLALAAAGDRLGNGAVEVRVRHRDGGWRLLEARGRDLRSDEAVRGVVLNARDITEQRAAEEALRASQEQLLQAQKMEAVGRLAGGIAHDFNNLLTAVLGHVGILLEEVKDEVLREGLAEVRRAGERAAALTRQLLAFSRRQMLQPRIVDLNAVVSEMQRMLRRLIGEDIELVTRLDPALGLVLADPGQLEQVVMNLAVNARDAMPDGGRLTLETANVELDEEDARTRCDVEPGRYVVLAVADTGRGIPPDVLPHIFEPFFTTKETGKGTGLGLSTVYGIVQQSDGRVTVESVPGEGAVFRIWLPRVEGEATERRGPPAAPGGTETVLLVEDETAVRDLMKRVLERRGYRVLEAASGEEAIRLAASFAGRIDLLLTDVVMPGMGGRELIERLARVRPGVRVLFVSGYTEDAVVRRGISQAEVAFLPKPFPPETLARKVREVLDGPAGGPGAASGG